MTKEEKIKMIVDVIYDKEDDLSDGFGYYSKPPIVILEQIANTILNNLENAESSRNEKTFIRLGKRKCKHPLAQSNDICDDTTCPKDCPNKLIK